MEKINEVLNKQSVNLRNRRKNVHQNSERAYHKDISGLEV